MQENEGVILIDIHAAMDGVMNPRDGTQKDACWNSLITILKVLNLPKPGHALGCCEFCKLANYMISISTSIMYSSRTQRLVVLS